MSTRREFLQLAVITTAGAAVTGAVPSLSTGGPNPGPLALGSTRKQWLRWLEQVSAPVLAAGSLGQLATRLPIPSDRADRVPFCALESAGRLLAGLAPWLECDAEFPYDEAALQTRARDRARRMITHLVDPQSPGRVDLNAGEQIVVDAAFLAEALLRAPKQLWELLEPSTQSHLVSAFQATRVHLPVFNNHLLFAAIIEAFLARVGQPWDVMRVDYALHQHEEWYRGDGIYSDGPELHFDYYNSIVIHPMLLDVLEALASSPGSTPHRNTWKTQEFSTRMLARAQRSAVVHERLISPEGTLPPVGRSLTYRSGLLHGLAHIALIRKLPAPLTPASVREALGAVMHRLLDVPGTFDEQGWLRLGFCGAQPALAETYISVGSLYLTALSLLPLGLPPTDAFWTDPPAAWTAQRVYAGENGPRDTALHP